MRWVPGEALRNILAGTTHALRYTLALALLVGTGTAADVVTVDQMLQHAATVRDSGGSVLTIESVGGVDGAACAALENLPQVRAAGALRHEETPITTAVLPRGPLATFTVTDGLVDLVDASGTGSVGIVLSEDAATALGARAGDDLVIADGRTARIRGTYPWPDDGRRTGYAYAALVPGHTDQRFDQCWVAAWPVPDDLTALLRAVVVPTDEQPDGTVTLLNATHGTSFDGAATFTDRLTRFAVWFGVVAGLAVGGMAVLARRLELAAARHLGVRPAQQSLQVLLESLCWVLSAGVLVAGLAAVLVGTGSPEDPGALVRVALHAGLPGLVAALLGGQLALCTVRERQLFRYFKER